jgi:putative transposase
MYYYRSVKDDSEVEQRLLYYAQKLPSRGCPEYVKRIRREGYSWNHKRIERVYRKLGLNKRRRKIKRRIPNPEKKALLQPIAPNITWSADFMQDRLENGRKIRILNVIDDYNRQALMCHVSFSFPSTEVVELMTQLVEWNGAPVNIRTDNGTEFLAKVFEDFCSNSGINHLRIQKGKPMQNGYIERFNRSFREDVLDAYLFENKKQVQLVVNDWMEDYNNHHPHDSLGGMPPIEFKSVKSA